MRKVSLLAAKAHLSALVDEAEYRSRSTVIVRHGKPAAAIVPVGVAIRGRPGSGRTLQLSAATIRRLFGRFGRGRQDESAVADLLTGRR